MVHFHHVSVASRTVYMVGVCRFGKQIRYASRKARADTRKRVKGRFVKAGEAYDYDPVKHGTTEPDHRFPSRAY